MKRPAAFKGDWTLGEYVVAGVVAVVCVATFPFGLLWRQIRPHRTAPRAFPVSLPRPTHRQMASGALVTDLTVVRDALEGLTDPEFHALIVTTNESPQIAPGLLAWIKGACNWEVNRRTGRHNQLLPPDAAIDPTEDAVSIQAIYAMRASFASSDFAPAALKFFDVLLKLLTEAGRKQH